ncbi:YkgJ family cysteine cluster protein [bacterium]|nr:YkgJ family cysteine cluster protein [bacterium]
MKIISKLKSYIFTPNRCFIPRCKARCCADAPLPEGYAQKVEGFAYRKVYNAVNIGENTPGEGYNSIVYNTRPVPLIMIGHAGGGKHVYYYDKKMAQKMGVKNMEEAQKALLSMEAQERYNYCPFLNEQGRCRVYPMRPPICREFGTSPLPINYCHQKSSRYDIFMFYAKQFSPSKIFNFYKNLIISSLKRTQEA